MLVSSLMKERRRARALAQLVELLTKLPQSNVKMVQSELLLLNVTMWVADLQALRGLDLRGERLLLAIGSRQLPAALAAIAVGMPKTTTATTRATTSAAMAAMCAAMCRKARAASLLMPSALLGLTRFQALRTSVSGTSSESYRSSSAAKAISTARAICALPLPKSRPTRPEYAIQRPSGLNAPLRAPSRWPPRIETVSLEAALDGADALLLALPDNRIAGVLEKIHPQIPAGTIVIMLDIAVAHAGLLPNRPDLTYFITHPCHPPVLSYESDPLAHRDFFGGEHARQRVDLK